jgi:hypothetical protein
MEQESDTMTANLSTCCGASVYVAGTETHYYVCESCEMPCDVVDIESIYDSEDYLFQEGN